MIQRKQALARYRELIALHLGEASGWKARLSPTRSKTGTCDYAAKTLSLSIFYVDSGVPMEQLEQTMLHEIAHAQTPGDAHGPRWVAAALALGVHEPSKWCDVPGLRAKMALYIAVCCSKTYSRNQRVPDDYTTRCPNCLSHLTWTKTTP